MLYKEINGKKLSQMTLGTVQLGMNYGIANNLGQPSQEKSNAMLRSALENGVTSLDTARGYGESEDVLGAFLKTLGEKNRPFLTSKLSVALPTTASEKEVEAAMFASLETSLKKLGVNKLDCLLLHTAADMTQYGDIVPKVLEKMIQQNYLGMAGVSVYFPSEVDTMLKNDLYQAIQVPMSLFDQTLIHKGYIDRLQKKNALVFVRSVFLQGLFFLDPDTMTDPQLAEFAGPHLRKLRELCQKTGLSISEFAISYIRDVPGVTSLVLGADTPEQVTQNIEYMQAPALSAQVREEAKAAFSAVNLEKIMEVLRRPKAQ